MLRVVPLTYSVHVGTYYGLSLILLGNYPIVYSQIRCYVTCSLYTQRKMERKIERKIERKMDCNTISRHANTGFT